MGTFLTVTAIKSKSVTAVAAAVIQYIGDYGVTYNKLNNDELPNGKEIAIYKSSDDWAVVIWPSYFNTNELPTIKYLSKNLNTLVSSVSIYDGESWSHTLYGAGKELDLYSSNFRLPIHTSPSFRIVSWSPDTEVISKNFDVKESDILCYFEDTPAINDNIGCSVSMKTAGSPWVFTDFWAKVGIKYPIPDIPPYEVYRLETGYASKLPE